MIVAFTSTAFNDFVAQYIKTSGDSTFNPYLQFLFFALYVPLLPFPFFFRRSSFIQSWSIGDPLRRIFLVPCLPIIRILTRFEIEKTTKLPGINDVENLF